MSDVETEESFATLQQLLSKRTTIKAQTTRFATFVEACEKHKSIIDLASKLQFQRQNFIRFEAVADRILELIKTPDADKALQDRLDLEDKHFTICGHAERLLEHLSPKPTDNGSTSSSMGNHSTHDEPRQKIQVKLPMLELPKFSGLLEEWVAFHDLFDSLINKNESLSDIQRFHYLKTSLRGEAANAIQALSVSTNNYQIAWKTLKEQFENKKLITENHLRQLFSLRRVDPDSASSIRNHLNDFQKHVRALQAMGEPSIDTFLLYLSTSKLDYITKDKWEEHCQSIKEPILQTLTEFLSNRCKVLESRVVKATTRQQHKPSTASGVKTSTNVAVLKKCPCCCGDHRMFHCEDFKKLDVPRRAQLCEEKALCIKCFSDEHKANRCQSRNCFKCYKKHHTLLHRDSTVAAHNSAASTSDLTSVQQPHTSRMGVHAGTVDSSSVHNSRNSDSHVLLSTVIIKVYDKDGNTHDCRALLDNGSQSNIITTALVERLGLKQTAINIPVVGIGAATSHIRGSVLTHIKSRTSNYESPLSCLVMSQITNQLPSSQVNYSSLKIPPNLPLADPTFYIPGPIDMLLGAGIFWELLCVGQHSLGLGEPVLNKTKLGWIVSGVCPTINKNISVCMVAKNDELDTQLTKFWEIENVTTTQQQPTSYSESHFTKHVRRDESGRFIVRLPFNELKEKLGTSRNQALRRFQTLERKFKLSSNVYQQYSEFMSEYIKLGHMTEIPEDDIDGFYLPHHAVFRSESVTTKCRVVFDASAKSTSGLSLNDAMHTGPVIQDELVNILMRFRKHKVVLNSDIVKMYRQVLVDPRDRAYQRILWRFTPTSEIKTYELATVTYGTTCAPFLATRSLTELANVEDINSPKAAEVFRNDFYVDDCITGCDTVEEALELKTELIQLAKKAGLELQKWRSNMPSVMDSDKATSVSLTKLEDMKTLGLWWDCSTDILHYSIPSSLTNRQSRRVTKRTILSDIAQLFDPLGLVGPIVITAKILMQTLWKLQLEWDESVPTDIYTKWEIYRAEICDLEGLKIPRHISSGTDLLTTELHGFCDASEKAFGACVYIRTVHKNHHVDVRLLCAKSRVAPLKNQSIPRLELCGALLLANLVEKVRCAMKITFSQEIFWTDSSIIIAWIKSTSNIYKTFVANRISEIQSLTDQHSWRHVRSEENPADIISRGMNPNELLDCTLWWNGPEFLFLPPSEWPVLQLKQQMDPSELRPPTQILLTTEEEPWLINRYSSYNKLRHITAYCLRFIKNCRSVNRTYGPLSTSEISEATTKLVRLVQRECFSSEIDKLTSKEKLSKGSKLLSLNPVIDAEGIIRVGGRLQGADISYNQKHPIILPSRNQFTELVITHEHHRHLHAGSSALLAAIRCQYWPISGKSTVKKIIRQCMRCRRARPRIIPPIMGNLPEVRVRPNRPFAISGVDFCGPYNLLPHRHRGAKTYKHYVAVFVCFTTKAVHLELVGALSTEACLNAIKRFISRRGIISKIYSDNGTNFVGVHNELKQLFQMVQGDELQRSLVDLSIEWNFIPPRSPHFGGLWEAAVKSAKHHLYRMSANASLTLEEMTTLLTQVEACLNSRPLTPLSEDVNDLQALTPGHFLIGTSLTALPEADLEGISINRLSHWQHVQAISQHFWKRWSKEYLGELQRRNKWKQSQPSLKPGMLVTIREDNLAPLQWKMGRILEIHPGPDGVARVATVRDGKRTSKVSIIRLSSLPSDETE